MVIKKSSRRQIEFHKSLEHEEQYVAKDEDDALHTICLDAIIRTVEFCDSHAAIFVKIPTDVYSVKGTLIEMLSLAVKFKKKNRGLLFKLCNGSTIEIRYVGEGAEAMWALAGAEWQWEYFYRADWFSLDQYRFIVSRARNYPNTSLYSARSILIREDA